MKRISLVVVSLALVVFTACQHGEDMSEIAQRISTDAGSGCVDPPGPTLPNAFPGTLPMHPAWVGWGGRPFPFDCFGGCGPSCNLVNQCDWRQTICQQYTNCAGTTSHMQATYRFRSGSTAPFCQWHDMCVFLASSRFDTVCERVCDAAMPWPVGYVGGCDAINSGSAITSGPAGVLGTTFTAAQVQACSYATNNSISATCPPGPSDCVALAVAQAKLFPGTFSCPDDKGHTCSESLNTMTWSEVDSVIPWGPGPCPAGVPILPSTPSPVPGSSPWYPATCGQAISLHPNLPPGGVNACCSSSDLAACAVAAGVPGGTAKTPPDASPPSSSTNWGSTTDCAVCVTFYPSGCRDGTGAIKPGDTDTACGSNGAACQACGGGDTCKWVAAGAGAIRKCSGGCGPGSNMPCADGCCATNGVDQLCLRAGVCGTGGAKCLSCKAAESCVNNTCVANVCGPGTTNPCTNGCCNASKLCQSGTTTLACGMGGAACVTCASGTDCSESRTCVACRGRGDRCTGTGNITNGGSKCCADTMCGGGFCVGCQRVGASCSGPAGTASNCCYGICNASGVCEGTPDATSDDCTIDAGTDPDGCGSGDGGIDASSDAGSGSGSGSGSDGGIDASPDAGSGSASGSGG